MNIRKATLDDLATVQDLNHDLFIWDAKSDPALNVEWPYNKGAEYFTKIISGEKGVCFVAEDNDAIIGYLAGCKCNDNECMLAPRAEVENMFVREDYRGKGVGTQLIQAFFDWSKGQGINHVLVGAYTKNEPAVAFYKKQGFKPHVTMLEKILPD